MSENDQKQQIVGTWRSDPDDHEAISEYGDVSLEFSPNGGLKYTVHTEGKRQIMLLAYRVEGNALVTDQPSDPKEERTMFEIRADGKLILLHEHRPSTYVRANANEGSSSPLHAVNLN
jgi:hypothetical protein